MPTEKEIEAAARALCIFDRKDPDDDWRVGDGVMLSVAVDPGKHHRWRTYAKAAKAALIAAESASRRWRTGRWRVDQLFINGVFETNKPPSALG